MYLPSEQRAARARWRRHGISVLGRIAHAMPNAPTAMRAVEALSEWVMLPDDVITIGRWSYFDGVPTVNRYPGAPDERITVGNFTSIAKEVTFVLSGSHDHHRVTTSPVRYLFGVEGYDTSGEISGRGGIVIGNDVWIGRGALIMSGARIEDGAVVGARAVVAGTVPPYAIVIGNPVREVRKRFDDPTIERLRASRWWDLPDDVLRRHIDLLGSRDINGFLSAIEGACTA